MSKASIAAEIAKLRKGIFGQQKSIVEFLDRVEAELDKECPECARRREQTRLRVAKVRAKPAGKLKAGVPRQAQGS